MRTKTLAVLALILGLALAVAACDKWPWQAAEKKPANTSIAAKRAAPSPSGSKAKAVSEDQIGLQEVQLEDLTGIWRVTGVIAGSNAKFANNDSRIIGSLMDVFPEQISWSRKASPEFGGTDICFGPVSAVIDEARHAESARMLLAPALSRMKEKIGTLARPHRWMCGDGGDWGNEAEFQPIAPGKIAMRWPGDLTLMLDRISRPSTNPPPLEPTGAYEAK